MLDMIVKFTNTFAQSKVQWRADVTIPKLKAFFAMCIFMGIVKLPDTYNYSRIKHVFHISAFREVMPRSRWLKIYRNLHVCDEDDLRIFSPSQTTIWIADTPLFYSMLAKVLYFSLTFSLTVLHTKLQHLGHLRFVRPVFFYLCLAPMRTDKIFTFWTSGVQFRFEGVPRVPGEKDLYYYTWLESW